MTSVDAPSLRQTVANARAPAFLFDRDASVRYTDLAHGTSLGGRLSELAGRSVLVATGGQLTAALALIELDGIARRIVILPPDADPAYLDAVVAAAEIDAIVTSDGTLSYAATALPLRVDCAASIMPADALPPARLFTEWLMMTSGTTGVPKLVVHTLTSLAAAVRVPSPADGGAVWATFYDIRRYGGLQMLLRALMSGASMVLSCVGETVTEHLERLAGHKVTNLAGTPSHWRRALMSPAIRGLAPRYVRLSGEIADQAILDALHAAFPRAAIGHAYASTEAGVVFDVNDGLAGFPASYIGAVRDGVTVKIVDGSLRVRSSRAAARYAGRTQKLLDAEGFVDTGDIVELRGDRYHFVGRNGGIINIGGLKVHPEEVEAVINRHPLVRMSLVRRKQSPVTGAIVVADVVLNAAAQGEGTTPSAVKDDILRHCRATLPRHKVPAAISFVPTLNVGGATGKLLRRNA